MADHKLHPELERRLKLLADPANQGQDFDSRAWAVLIGLGVALPILALLIGR